MLYPAGLYGVLPAFIVRAANSLTKDGQHNGCVAYPWRGKLNVRPWPGTQHLEDASPLSAWPAELGSGRRLLTEEGVHLPLYPSPRTFFVPIAPVQTRQDHRGGWGYRGVLLEGTRVRGRRVHGA